MPFASEAQRRWMHANKPEMAARWEAEAAAEKKKRAAMTKLGESWKTPVQTLDDGTLVCLVDGEYVRNNVYTDFVLGGNPARYNFVPENEIWIERSTAPSEIEPTILHERTERDLMLHDRMSYENAHEEATQVEQEARGVAAQHEQPVNEYASERVPVQAYAQGAADALEELGLSKVADHAHDRIIERLQMPREVVDEIHKRVNTEPRNLNLQTGVVPIRSNGVIKGYAIVQTVGKNEKKKNVVKTVLGAGMTLPEKKTMMAGYDL